MAKLTFKYSAMNAGKTTILIMNAHSYDEKGLKVIVVKPSRDSKGNDEIVARSGLSRKVDELIDKDDNVVIKLRKYFDDLKCIFIDEAQFLQPEQIKQFYYITKKYNIPVIAYGLRTDFKMNGFDGSPTLMCLADSLEELTSICECGDIARFNARKVNDEFVYEGESVVIDGESKNTKYIPLCGKCYVDKVLSKYNNYDEDIKRLTLNKED